MARWATTGGHTRPVLSHTGIDEAVTAIEGELVGLRRDIHRRPELAGGEERTAALVADRLRAEGLDVTTGIGGHGLVAVVEGAEPGPVIAYRADLDAVADTERSGEEFSSEVPGAAHLCGHDLHTAIGVGLATTLHRLREQVRGRVAFLFQPAEEDLTGARAMIADGVLERIAPREIYALHCAPLPTGTLAVMPGAGLPGQDYCRVRVSGPDAAAGAERLAGAMGALSTVAPPASPEQLRQMIEDLQTPDGPLARFVFAVTGVDPAPDGSADAWAALRAWPDDRYPALRDELRRLAGGNHVEFPPEPFPAMICPPEQSLAAAELLRAAPGVTGMLTMRTAYPFNGEDFALFLRRVPGAMVWLGVADEATGRSGVLHDPGFRADERAIGIGVRAMAHLLTRRLHEVRARSGGSGPSVTAIR